MGGRSIARHNFHPRSLLLSGRVQFLRMYEIFEQPMYTKWNSFRQSDDARYVGGFARAARLSGEEIAEAAG